MPRYKVIDERGCYLARDPTVVRLELGADANAARAYSVRAAIHEHILEGAEIDMPDGFVPGPHLLPLDDAAKKAMAQYLKDRPGATLDPTRSLPLGQDPMQPPSLEASVLRTLERMAEDAAGASAAPSAGASDAKLDALVEQITRLAGIVGQIAQPAPATRQR
jgi:hypothetical protein